MSATDHEQSATDHEQSATDREQSATDHEQSATDHEQSATDREQSATDREQSATDREQSADTEMSQAGGPQDELEDSIRASDWALLRRLWPFVRPNRSWLWVVLFAIPLGIVAELVQPMLIKRGIDGAIAQGTVEGLGGLTLAYVALVALGFGLRTLGMHALQIIGLRTLWGLRKGIFAHVLDQGQRFFDRRTTGSLLTRTTTEVEAVYESLAFGAVGLVTDILTILGILAIMFSYDWQLTLISFSLAPLIVWIVNVCRKHLRVLFSEIRKQLSVLNGYFAERVHGMQVIQLYGAEAQSVTQFREQAYSYARTYQRANWWDAGLYAVMDGMGALAVGIMLAYGATRFSMTPGEGVSLGLLVAFIDYLHRIFEPIRQFSGRIAMLQRSVSALERVFGLLEIEEAVEGGAQVLEEVEGHVRFEQVRFAYAEDKPTVLDGVDLEIRPGEVVALVGATGSGKSTIGKLLLRSYDGYEGRITLDGQEIRGLRIDDVRRAVTVVHQDAHIFEGTVADNIGLLSPRLDRAQIERAAQRACAQEFIEQLEGGFDAHCQSGGSNLSGGQRQLIAIARAMAWEAPVVILDEATASVDALTERAIDAAVAALFAEKTVLVVAHRLSTIMKADRILMLHAGRVVEQGTHAELMARGGRYARLVASDFKGEQQSV